MKHYIIYIPGLGDHYDGVRRFFLFFWQVFGVKTQLVPMQWYGGSSYGEKYERIKIAIMQAQARGFSVSVIGESAGGSMAMNVFAADESLHRMISLCGVNNQATPISSHIFKKSHAFKSSVLELKTSQDIATQSRIDAITSITALYDPTVPIVKNIIPDAKHIKVWSVGHVTTILLCLSLYSPLLIHEIKRALN